ncbi:MAG: DUF3784 domain-containing protein [Chitinivibrionales bacterium]
MTFSITFISVGMVSLVFGYLLAYKHKVSLINGYNPKRITDPRRYSELLGMSQLAAGVMYMIIGILGIFLNIHKILAVVGLVVSIGFITALVLVQKKYSVAEYDKQ